MITSIDQIKMSLTTLGKVDQQTVTQLIMTNEGFRAYVYEDSTGDVYQWENNENPTWLCGLNLRIPGDIQMAFLMTTYKICQIESDLIVSIPFFIKMPATVKMALLDMAYTLGVSGLLTFTGFLGLLKGENWTMAANDLKTSKWYVQATTRAQKDQTLILKANANS